MNKNKPRMYTMYSFSLPVIALLLFAAIGTFVAIKAPRGGDGSVLSSEKANKGGNSSNKDEQSKVKENNGKLVIDMSKSVKSQEHRVVVDKVVKKLDTVSTSEEESGNTDTAEEIDTISQEIEDQADETEDVINAVESRPKWQSVLFGADYKNLGQLRSSLAHNENSIRKLNKELVNLPAGSSADLIQAQIQTLTQERTQMQTILKTNEESFSILGWFFRFMSGYDSVKSMDTLQSSESTQSGSTE